MSQREAKVPALLRKNRHLRETVLFLRKESRELQNEIFRLKGLKLPPDIVPLIIEQLRFDRRSLKICSLVCRDWLRLARPHLFQRIVYVASTNIEKTSKAENDHLAILRRPSCTIFPHVRTIHIHGGDYDGGYTSDDEQRDDDEMDEFLSFLDKFCSLTGLVLDAMRGKDDLDRLKPSLTAIRGKITYLELDHSLFKFGCDRHTYPWFIADFPCLETLSIRSPEDFRPADRFYYRSFPQPPTTLRKLCFVHDPSHGTGFEYAVLKWLLDSGYSKLDAIEIWDLEQVIPAADILSKYMNLLGPSLQYFKLIGRGNSYTEFMPHLIAANTALRHVDICCQDGLVAFDWFGKSFYLPTNWTQIISRLPSSVESILLEVCIRTGGAEHWEIYLDYDWSLIDQLLGGSQYPILGELVIWSQKGGDRAFDAHIRQGQSYYHCVRRRVN